MLRKVLRDRRAARFSSSRCAAWIGFGVRLDRPKQSADQNGVAINNPYTNRRQFYDWEQMYASWGRRYLELIPPPNSPPSYQHFGPAAQEM
jgi:hypothetical protein